MIRAVGRSGRLVPIPAVGEAGFQSLTRRICAISPASVVAFQSRGASFSSSSSSSSHPHGPSAQRARLGIGGAKLAQQSAASNNLEVYSSVIATSLHSGITTFESGHGGESNLSNAYQAAMNHLREEDANTVNEMDHVTLTARFGYRTVPAGATSAQDQNGHGDGDYLGHYPNDVQVEEAKPGSSSSSSSGGNKQATSKGGGDLDDQSDDVQEDMDALTKSGTDGPTSGGDVAVHNLSRQYVAQCLAASPLVRLCAEQRVAHSRPDVRLVYLAHNPEAQGAALAGRGAPLDEIRELVKERLTDAFIGLETGKAEGLITSYGVCSNGLSLPDKHPLHLPWMDVLNAASDAVCYVHGFDTVDGIAPQGTVAGLSTIQLPANLLETNGLNVAQNIKTYLDTDPGDDGDETPEKFPSLPSSVDVYVTRPLTCYPDQGTGSGHPFKLVDYQIDTTPTADLTSGMKKVWTNTLGGSRPPHYGPALATTMAHFDATAILEAGEERKLTVEERETLDGCRLLQSMIHDLDNSLDTIRSFAAYEEDLYNKVVPLIHDTFEELDEDSAMVLQSFFVAHGAAVRHAIANTTRELLKVGGDGVPPYEVPDDVTLQEFALQHLLKQTQIDKVIVGCPQAEYVLEALHAADKL